MKSLFLLLCAAGFSGCTSTQLLRDRDYEASVAAFKSSEPERALMRFPKGEAGGFITSVERAWLEQWAGQWRPESLAKQAETVEQRQPVWLSEEAGVLLRAEREHQYLPAEHEVVTLHLLYATHLLQRERFEDARVELRRAAQVLELQWDDPGLRLWLAALWTAAGEWPEAQVDLRRAHELGGDGELLSWAESETPPPHLRVHFFGVAPEIRWQSGSHKPGFSVRSPRPAVAVASSTSRWFERHHEKDHLVREVAREGHHLAVAAGNQTLSLTERTGAKAITWGVRLTGVAVGAGLTAGALYALSKANLSTGGGELLAATVAIGYGIWKFGAELDRQMMRYLDRRERTKQEELRTYRLVRFLPEWIGLSSAGVMDAPLGPQIALRNGVYLHHHAH